MGGLGKKTNSIGIAICSFHFAYLVYIDNLVNVVPHSPWERFPSRMRANKSLNARVSDELEVPSRDPSGGNDPGDGHQRHPGTRPASRRRGRRFVRCLCHGLCASECAGSCALCRARSGRHAESDGLRVRSRNVRDDSQGVENLHQGRKSHHLPVLSGARGAEAHGHVLHVGAEDGPDCRDPLRDGAGGPGRSGDEVGLRADRGRTPGHPLRVCCGDRRPRRDALRLEERAGHDDGQPLRRRGRPL